MSDYLALDELPLLFRGYSDIAYRHPKRIRSRRTLAGRRTLFDDWETIVENGKPQRGMFGTAILADDQWNGHDFTYKIRKLIIYYKEYLTKLRRLTYKIIKAFAEEIGAEFIHHKQYVVQYFLKLGYPDVLAPEYHAGTIIQANATFDMPRHGARTVAPRGTFRNGIGCELLPGEQWAPYYRAAKRGIGVQHQLTRRMTGFKKWNPPAILDILQLVRAMTGKRLGLGPAGKVYGCEIQKEPRPEVFDPENNYHGPDKEAKIWEFVRYAFGDVRATLSLSEKVLSRFYRHPIDVNPWEVYSAATFTKAYQRAMGVHGAFCTCEDCKPQCKCKIGPVCSDSDCDHRVCVSRRQCPKHPLRGEPAKSRGAWDVKPEILGLFASSFLGARSEIPIRWELIPGRLYDWRSMYPTVMLLQGIWDIHTSKYQEVRQETREVQAFLDRVTLADLRKWSTWKQMVGVAEYYPQPGLLVPQRGDHSYNGKNAIAVSSVSIPDGDMERPPLVSAIAMLVASKLRTGVTPKICSAYRVYGTGGKQDTLKPVEFGGNHEFDPSTGQWPKFMVELRTKLKLYGDEFDEQTAFKEIINAFYGIFAEMNMKTIKSTVYSIGSQPQKSGRGEEMGEYGNVLLAPAITAAAHLMLAMMQAQAGSPAMTDTDSFFIPCTTEGTQADNVSVGILSHSEAQRIAESFDTLNPYDPELIPHLLDMQAEGTIFGVSAKRYAIFDMVNGEPVIPWNGISDGDDEPGEFDSGENDEFDADDEFTKRSEHGFGLYISPYALDMVLSEDNAEREILQKRFISEAWSYGILRYGLGQNVSEPWWFDLPALSRFPVSTAHVLKIFNRVSRDPGTGKVVSVGVNLDIIDGEDVFKPYDQQIVGGAFYLAAYRPRHTALEDLGRQLRLIAPFGNLQSAMRGKFTDANTGREYSVTINPDEAIPDEILLIKTLRDVVHEYFTHPEFKYNGPDGRQCRGTTRGLLTPKTIKPAGYRVVSRDSSSVATAGEGFEHSGPHIYRDDSMTVQMGLVRNFLTRKRIGRYQLQSGALVPEKVARNFISGKTEIPRQDNWHKIVRFAWRVAKDDLGTYARRITNPFKTLKEWNMRIAIGDIPLTAYKHEIVPLPDEAFWETGTSDDPTIIYSETLINPADLEDEDENDYDGE